MLYRHSSQRYVAPSQADKRLESGLVAHYSTLVSGLTWVDISQNRINGVISTNDVEKVPGMGGRIGIRTGIGTTDYGYTDCGINDQARPTGAMSVCMWLRWLGDQVDSNRVIYDGSSQGSGYYALYNPDLDSVTAGLGVYIAGNSVSYQTNFREKEWHHMASVYDGSANMYLYIDGVLVGTNSSASGSPSYFNDQASTIGANTVGGSPWRGDLDDFRIYNRALNQAEVTLLANRAQPMFVQTNRRTFNTAGGGGVVKTWDGISWASVNALDGVASPSIKTVISVAAQ